MVGWDHAYTTLPAAIMVPSLCPMDSRSPAAFSRNSMRAYATCAAGAHLLLPRTTCSRATVCHLAAHLFGVLMVRACLPA